MLKTIISITGKPGLYKILSQGRGSLIVESLTDGRRFPVHSRDKLVSLGDISMYTDNGDLLLGEILDKVYVGQNGEPVDYKKMNSDTLRETFGKYVPDFDRERVRDSDIRKLFQWYNLLVAAGLNDFAAKDEEGDEEKAEAKESENS